MTNKNQENPNTVIKVSDDTTPSTPKEATVTIPGMLFVSEPSDVIGAPPIQTDVTELKITATSAGTYVADQLDHPDNNGKPLVNYEINLVGTDKSFNVQIPEGGYVKDAIDPNTGKVVGKTTVAPSEMLKNAINANFGGEPGVGHLASIIWPRVVFSFHRF